MSVGQPTGAQGGVGTSSLAGRRVLVIGARLTYEFMEWHVMDALAAMGAVAEFVPTELALPGPLQALKRPIAKFANLALREPERLSERQIVDGVARFAPEIVLVILGNALSPKTVSLMRRVTRAPIVCWCQDQMTTLGRQFLIGAEYDAVFVKDHYLQDLFSRMIRSSRFYYLAEACNPRVHRPIELTEAERRLHTCDVMVAGTLYYYRQAILEQLAEFDVRVWGNVPDWLVPRLRWPHMGREIVSGDKVAAARAARVALNPLHFAEVNGLNCRAFELAGCGALQLVTDKPALHDHFVDGRELVSFRTVDELIERVRHFVKNPEEAQKISEHAVVRAHAEHAYEHRLERISSIVGLK